MKTTMLVICFVIAMASEPLLANPWDNWTFQQTRVQCKRRPGCYPESSWIIPGRQCGSKDYVEGCVTTYEFDLFCQDPNGVVSTGKKYVEQGSTIWTCYSPHHCF